MANVSQKLLDAVIQQESGGDPLAVSPDGAVGLGQWMPKSAAQPGFGVEPGNPDNPAENIRMTREYLGAMKDRYGGDTVKALAAYNWGPGNVDEWDGDPSKLPQETQGYIDNIMGDLEQGSRSGPPSTGRMGNSQGNTDPGDAALLDYRKVVEAGKDFFQNTQARNPGGSGNMIGPNNGTTATGNNRGGSRGTGEGYTAPSPNEPSKDANGSQQSTASGPTSALAKYRQLAAPMGGSGIPGSNKPIEGGQSVGLTPGSTTPVPANNPAPAPGQKPAYVPAPQDRPNSAVAQERQSRQAQPSMLSKLKNTPGIYSGLTQAGAHMMAADDLQKGLAAGMSTLGTSMEKGKQAQAEGRMAQRKMALKKAKMIAENPEAFGRKTSEEQKEKQEELQGFDDTLNTIRSAQNTLYGEEGQLREGLTGPVAGQYGMDFLDNAAGYTSQVSDRQKLREVEVNRVLDKLSNLSGAISDGERAMVSKPIPDSGDQEEVWAEYLARIEAITQNKKARAQGKEVPFPSTSAIDRYARNAIKGNPLTADDIQIND